MSRSGCSCGETWSAQPPEEGNSSALRCRLLLQCTRPSLLALAEPAFPHRSKAPWYLDQTPGRAGLKHQKKPDDGKVRPGLDSAVLRGQKVQAATKFRKGACENCGAMSHKTRDCLERPRRKGARWTGRDIAPDEVVARGGPEDYDSKRDRWAGYDPAEHRRVLAEYEAVEAERRRLREEALDQQTSSDVGAAKKLAKKEKKRSGEDGFGSSDSDDDDEDKYTEKANMPGQKINTDTRITQRNLRIREDRAKYLYNLDLDSAYYDPKTRSMRDAPDPSVRPEDVSCRRVHTRPAVRMNADPLAGRVRRRQLPACARRHAQDATAAALRLAVRGTRQ